jgi:hypothetical protein
LNFYFKESADLVCFAGWWILKGKSCIYKYSRLHTKEEILRFSHNLIYTSKRFRSLLQSLQFCQMVLLNKIWGIG